MITVIIAPPSIDRRDAREIPAYPGAVGSTQPSGISSLEGNAVFCLEDTPEGRPRVLRKFAGAVAPLPPSRGFPRPRSTAVLLIFQRFDNRSISAIYEARLTDPAGVLFLAERSGAVAVAVVVPAPNDLGSA